MMDSNKYYDMKAPGLAGEVKLDELYQEVILDHNRNPRNFNLLTDANACSHGYNPLCGDDYELSLYIDKGGTISKVGFKGQGCAISKASASLMTEAIKGRSLGEAEMLKDNFVHLLTDSAVSDPVRQGAGKMKFFEGVKNFPIRVKCATLIWRALEDALMNYQKEGEKK